MKRIAAIGTGVAMVGATLTGAMALDLADYPAPFVVGGTYDDSNALVVGDLADAADTLGMVDIASNLQFESKVAVASEGTTVSVTGGKTEQVPLGLGLSNSSLFDTTLQDDDISNLFDGEITFQGTAYDTSEELALFDRTDPSPVTSLTSSDDDYGSNVYLEVANRDAIRFYYNFDEGITLNATTSADPLEIDFLGHHLKITNVNSNGNALTAYVGEEHYLSSGNTVDVVVNGVTKTITLIDVSSTSAVVEVDGTSKIIGDGSTSTVNGVEITVDDVFSRTEREESSANLIIGAQSSETYTDGDEFIGEDQDDPNWVWNFEGLAAASATTQNISIENDFVYNDVDSGAIAEGGCIDLPNDYVSICYESLSVAADDYADYTLEFDASGDFGDTFTTNSSVPVIYLHTTVDEGFELNPYTNGTDAIRNESAIQRVEDVWLYTPSTTQLASGVVLGSGTKWIQVWYEDDATSKTKLFGEVNAGTGGTEILRVNYGNTKDTNIVLDTVAMPANTTLNITFNFDIIGDETANLANGFDDIETAWGLTGASGRFDSLGDTRNTEEASEVKWSTPQQNLGTKDEDHRSAYGIVIKNPESAGASDEVRLSVPQDIVKANIVIKGTSSTVTGGDVTYIPAEVTPVTKLASEVTTASDYNLILVGGPCANALVEDVFAVTCDGWSFEQGEAVVKLMANGDKVAMLVAGTTADDTRRAAKAIANHGDYDFSGAEVLVSGTSLTDINVATVSA